MSAIKGSVLVLGSGMCAPALVQYLDHHDYKVILASRTLAAAQKLAEGKKHVVPKRLDIEAADGEKLLEELVPQADAVISMLPYIHHPIAAKIAVKHKKHFLTTSYTTDAMKSLDQAAKDAGVIIINECGVDPGTDHMSAMRVIHRVHKNGGSISSFTSFCGGLPAPSCNDNPFGYKLSWAPRGVLLASRNAARYLKDGKIVEIKGEDLFDNYEVVEIPELGQKNSKIEAYPNRDSTKYIEVYGIPETKTILRGTYRNLGWCPTIKKLADLGYLSVDKQDLGGKTYAEVTAYLVGASKENVKQAVASKFGLDASHLIISNMEWIGLFSNEVVPKESGVSYLDALCHLFKEKLVYKPGEQDMLLMRHNFVADYPDRREYLSSTLIDFGIKNGHTSMSRTVGLPVAIAARLVLEGKIKLVGLQFPIIPEVYEPILDELEKDNIKFIEKVDKVEKK
jgi:saccharopine dehydrogenase (NADP+, L-glutamate forming)